MQAVWNSNFALVRSSGTEIGDNMLVLAGPSGVGKTSLATILTKLSRDVVIIKNYTTRPKREADPIGHFRYLSETEFNQLNEDQHFLLSRISPSPCYGYSLEDFRNHIKEGKRSIFMFRNSGVKYIMHAVGKVSTVFIKGDPALIANKSLDKVSNQAAHLVGMTLQSNHECHRTMRKRGWPSIELSNTYSGKGELVSMAQRVLSFIGDDHNRVK